MNCIDQPYKKPYECLLPLYERLLILRIENNSSWYPCYVLMTTSSLCYKMSDIRTLSMVLSWIQSGFQRLVELDIQHGFTSFTICSNRTWFPLVLEYNEIYLSLTKSLINAYYLFYERPLIWHIENNLYWCPCYFLATQLSPCKKM